MTGWSVCERATSHIESSRVGAEPTQLGPSSINQRLQGPGVGHTEPGNARAAAEFLPFQKLSGMAGRITSWWHIDVVPQSNEEQIPCH
jgi:hypothetical protein